MQHMIDPDTALQLVLDATQVLDPDVVSLHDAAGHVLAESIVSDRDYPPFARAMMDGYAVSCTDAGKTVPVVGEVAAGQVAGATVRPGQAIEIMTGAPCPKGTEAVVQKELVDRTSDSVSLPDDVREGQNIAPMGSECAQDTVVMAAGSTLTPLAIACAATFGVTHLRVHPRPSLAIITTGDELVPINARPGPAQIRNSNGIMLETMARNAGLIDIALLHAVDTPESLAECLAAANRADIVILSGAVSAGKYDRVPDALATIGAAPIFHKVTQRPGKPILFATRERQLYFGLPGNPLSCHLGFHRYVAPAVRMMTGHDELRPVLHGVLTEGMSIKGPRTVFQLAVARYESNEWYVAPCKGRGSADMYTGSRANALIRFEPDSGEVRGGATVFFELLDT
jgi:molybdopterin molybdotransferase